MHFVLTVICNVSLLNVHYLQAFANPEDASYDKKAKVTTSDPDVERVRR